MGIKFLCFFLMESLSSIDEVYFQKGFVNIAGIDEAGRGPWAGPVFCAAVILPRGHGIKGIDDSKKLSLSDRERLFDVIVDTAVAYSIVRISSTVIDRTDILTATKKGMQKAVKQLSVPPDMLLLDAVNINLREIPQVNLVKGDQRSECIAAASILAKVSRDRYMQEMDLKYPIYQFAQHKGYGTRAHHDALKKYGPCPIHRTSFRPVRELLSGKQREV